MSYRYEEHAGADVEAAESPEDPDALEASALQNLLHRLAITISPFCSLQGCLVCRVCKCVDSTHTSVRQWLHRIDMQIWRQKFW